jgi:hypothetical protein
MADHQESLAKGCFPACCLSKFDAPRRTCILIHTQTCERGLGPAVGLHTNLETGNESIRFSRSTAEAKKRIKAREQARKGVKQEPPQDAS